MFYIKTEHEGKNVQIDIYGDEIYTVCFNCGKEMKVEDDLLRDLVSGEHFSFCSTSIACCSDKKPQLSLVK